MTAALHSEIDTKLLAAVEEQVPLSPRPYADLASNLNLPESIVLERLRALHRGPQGVIRQIGAIFDSGSLGYRSTLVAAKVPREHLAAAAAIINQHPGVSHNYQRDHDYCLWYTLAVPPESILGLQTTAQILHQRCGATATRLLPALKVFKIGVKLNFDAGAERQPPPPSLETENRFTPTQPARPLSTREVDFVRVLQRDLPMVERPFDAWATELDISPEQLLAAAEQFRQRRIMRRFSAVLRHRELGFEANGMGVWIVPSERQEQFGAIAAGFPQVSHCYLRPAYDDWPYNLYTMVHARQRAEGDAVLKAISAATGIDQYTALYSLHEFKKVRLQYFTPDIPAWEEKHSHINSDRAPFDRR